jgi:type IV secretory pathway VirB4 component
LLNLKRLSKDYAEAEGFHTLLNLDCFVDERTLLTKSGDLMSVLELHGPDAESMEPQQIDAFAGRLTAALRSFDSSFVVNG